MHILEHNVETGEVIEIPLTAAEIKEIEKRQTAAIAEQAALEEAKAQAEADKAALLTRLGITAEEAKLLLS